MHITRLITYTAISLCLIICTLSCESGQTAGTQGKNGTQAHTTTQGKSQPNKSQSNRGTVTLNEEPAPPQLPTLLGHYPAYAKNANIYEVNLINYTPEGTFNAFADHLPRLKAMGIDILAFLPLYDPSNLSHVNPQMGTIDDLRALVRAVHKQRMKVIMTVDKLNDQNLTDQTSRKGVIDALKYWASKLEIDGYYMADADQVAESFWDEVYKALINTKQDLLMLAGGTVPRLKAKNYFHADTGEQFNSMLTEIAKGQKGPQDVVKQHKSSKQSRTKGFQLHYTSNHTLNSSLGPTSKTLGPAHDALAVLAYTIGGMPLMYGGQEEPLNKRLDHKKGNAIGFDKYLMEDWYQTIFKTKHMNQALWNGEFGGEVEWMQVDDQILSFKREKNGGVIYTVFNLSNTPATFESEIEVKRLMDTFNRRVVDLYKGTKIVMEPWTYKVYSNI